MFLIKLHQIYIKKTKKIFLVAIILKGQSKLKKKLFFNASFNFNH